MLEKLNELDQQLFLFLNSLHSPFWDTIMYWVSDRFIWAPFYLALFVFIIYRFKKQAFLIIPFAILLIVIVDQLAVLLFKNVFERLRPCHNPGLADLMHLVKDHCGGKYGFISNHAANSFGLAAYTSLLFNKKWFSTTLFTWAALVSYSRIYLGVHYPGDILGGMIFGILTGWLVFMMYQFTKKFLPELSDYSLRL